MPNGLSLKDASGCAVRQENESGEWFVLKYGIETHTVWDLQNG